MTAPKTYWVRGANLQFPPIGECGRKQNFQEYHGGRIEMAIARSFLDQLTSIFSQMESKVYIYVVQG